MELNLNIDPTQLPKDPDSAKRTIYVPPYRQRELDMLLQSLPHRSGEVAHSSTDSIYGRVPFSLLGKELVSHPIFQLTGKKHQLSFIYERYQGGTHTRKAHLMGAYWVVLRYLESLIERYQLVEVSPQTILAVVYATLLHDVGHYAHSHTFDIMEGVLPDHEWLTAQIIMHSELADILEFYGVSPLRVAELIDPSVNGLTHKEDELLLPLVSGSLDADKTDYIIRDARNLNVPLGINYDSIADCFVVVPWENKGKRLAIHSRWLAEVQAFLNARVELYQIGILNPDSRIMSEQLVAAVWRGMEVGALTRDPLEFWGLGDEALIDKLRGQYVGKTMPLETRELAEELYLGRSFPVVREISPIVREVFDNLVQLRGQFEQKKNLERRLAAALSTIVGIDIPTHHILISLPNPPKDFLKDLLVYSPNPAEGRETIESFAEASGMSSDVLLNRQTANQNVLIAAHPSVSDLLRQMDILMPVLLRALNETLDERES